MRQARMVVPPEVFIRHTAERSFSGPGLVQLANGDLLLATNWTRPTARFEQHAAQHPVPPLYRSRDGGRTWQDEGPMHMVWSLTGLVSDGGITLRLLRDGRLAFVANRHVPGLHGGGLPVLAFSADDGHTWTPARLVGQPEGVWYVMNDRMVELRQGRLVVPVACRPPGVGDDYIEGDRTLGLCFLSDDGGATWRSSRVPADLGDRRGMDEACVAELAEGRLLMLARTGSGCHHRAWSADGGDTWSAPEPTSLTAACSPLTLRALPDGRLIVAYNHAAPLAPGAWFPRTPLVYAVSADGGATWGEPRLLDGDAVETRELQHVYPALCFTEEGMLIVYSTHYADPAGSFSDGGQEGRRIGGGKRCIAAYPE